MTALAVRRSLAGRVAEVGVAGGGGGGAAPIQTAPGSRLLSAPAHVIVERLATRTNNSYGKHPDELVRVLEHIETVEPLLRRRATPEVDTSAPLDEGVDTNLWRESDPARGAVAR